MALPSTRFYTPFASNPNTCTLMKITLFLTGFIIPTLGWAQESPRLNPWKVATLEMPEAVINARVKAQTVKLGGGTAGGHLVMQVIEPPALVPVVPVPTTAASRLTLEDRAAKRAASPPHTECLFMPTVVVYDNGISLIRWWPDCSKRDSTGGQEYLAWVNLDLSSINGCGDFMAGKRHFTLLPTLSRAKTPFTGPLKPPALSDFRRKSDIILTAGDSTNKDAMEPVMALLAKYDTEGQLIVAADATIKADQKAQAAWEKANPEPPTHTVIKFWQDPSTTDRTKPAK